MSDWNKQQRFQAILGGELADRPIVSAWRHFIDQEQSAKALADASIDFQQKYDWDFVKINPRATYYQEIWGNTYDYNHYENVVPKLTEYVVRKPSDLGLISAQARHIGPILEQLETTRLVRQALGVQTPIIQTVFSPLAVLAYLAGQNPYPGAKAPADRNASSLHELIAHNSNGVHAALKEISYTLAEYVNELVKTAGADGIFYSVMGLGNEDSLSRSDYESFGHPYDLIVLEAVGDKVSILHTCGPASNPERFADYPVSAIHWANRAIGNPSLQSSSEWIGQKAVVGGVNEQLFGANQTNEIQAEAAETVEGLRDRPLILAAGCGIPLSTNDASLRALRDAVN
jgi:uroporphyrinogen decarboxylase